MKRHSNLWIEILATATVIAFALALLIATLGAAAGAVGGEPETGHARPPHQDSSRTEDSQRTYEGMITDTYCGAKHDARINRAAGDCVRICVHSGNSFALLSGEKIYLLNGDPVTLKTIAGMRARISGSLDGNTITVSSAAALT
jgi:hypothetical protein